jgi:hypothetical protein
MMQRTKSRDAITKGKSDFRKVDDNGKKRKRQSFTKGEIELMKRRRGELHAAGINDFQIGRQLAIEMGRSFPSIERKLHMLVRGGELGANKQKRIIRHFTDDEITQLCEQRNALFSENLTDMKIAKRISKNHDRHYVTIAGKIRELVATGVLQENPNASDYNSFSADEIAHIIKRHTELEAQGKSNNEISHIIGGELHRTGNSIYLKMRKLVWANHLKENRNKRAYNDFTDDEVQYIKKRRAELVAQGHTDFAIARIITPEIKGRFKLAGRTLNSLALKIHWLVQKGLLPSNPFLYSKSGPASCGVSTLISAIEKFGENNAKDKE